MGSKFRLTFESRIFCTFYLAIPFMLYLALSNTRVFHYYFIMSLFLITALSVYRILKENFSKDYDMMILVIVKIAHIATIFYTPKWYWMLNGTIIFFLLFSYTYRHSNIGLAEIYRNKLFSAIYMAFLLTLYFKNVQGGWFSKFYGVLLAAVFTYHLLCACKTQFFFRGIFYGDVALITLILVARYAIEQFNTFYLYFESIFIGLIFVCYLNWYSPKVYRDYLPFINKSNESNFFNKNLLANIFGVVALAVTICDFPLTKITIINSALVAAMIWFFYSIFIGLVNLVINIEDIDDIEYIDNSWELRQFLKILPESLRTDIIRKIEIKKARKRRCIECMDACNSIDHPPRFIQSVSKKENTHA